MENKSVKCPIATNAHSRRSYYQYYIGDTDQEQRNGRGENHWSGPESLEWYAGKFIRDTMHGEGEYKWMYKGPDGAFITYEGYFYGNRMHGYGVQSYPDGRTFNGLFYNNVRWGPGIESNTYIQENVGFWRHNQLVRLAWRPKAPFVTLDFSFGPAVAQAIVEPHRTLLMERARNIGEVNSAIELLKQSGSKPIAASEKWTKLYPKHCNDLASQMCYVDLFEHEYYNTKILELEEIDTMPTTNESSAALNLAPAIYYAWNNSDMLLSMMKHCFKHEQQRRKTGINLMNVLSGYRGNFKRAGKHEYDCRNLIMSSYLGEIHKIAQLISEDKVHPDVADTLGNTALMYAACGNQTTVINFLVEAGADVNSFNDSCCTPLAVALVRLACLCKDIPLSAMLQSLLPPPQAANQSGLPIQKPSEWNITRELPTLDDINTPIKITSKGKITSSQKSKVSATNIGVKKTDDFTKKKMPIAITALRGERSLEEERKIVPEENEYNEISVKYLLQVTNIVFGAGKPESVPYLFEITDMTTDIDVKQELTGKPTEKSKPHSNFKGVNTIKPSQDLMWHSSEKETSLSSADKIKIDMLDKSLATISQLLSNGADPRLVRCPQSALRIAVASGSSSLVRQLVQKGADINEVYPDANNYSILDMAVSRPLTENSLALVHTILEVGGAADHKLKCATVDAENQGPTLLHAVLAKHIENNTDEDISCQVLELLLQYNADPLHRFMGVSAIDMAMSKNLRFLDIFVKSPKTDINALINDINHTILSKMFSLDFFKHDPIDERLQALTHLLLYGADPLLECQEYEKVYENLFVYAKRNLSDLEPKSPLGVKGSKSEAKVINKSEAKVTKPLAKNNSKKLSNYDKKKDDKGGKPPAKQAVEDIADYKQAIDLVRNCVRILHMRWIQAKLLKELLGVVERYEHRSWNMILPEHKNKKACGLWLTMSRCLEIWDIFTAKKKSKIVDRRILRHMLCIVHFYCKRAKTSFKSPLTADEKGAIETDVCYLLQEYKVMQATVEVEFSQHLSRPYVTPELALGDEAKFKVCFECALPLPESTIRCSFCKQVSFCSLECMRMSIDQNVGIHPCSDSLKVKYFSSTADSSSALTNII